MEKISVIVPCYNEEESIPFFYEAITKEFKEIKTDYNLERAKYFLDAARTKFDNSFIAKRYLITVVADLSTEHGYKLVCDALKQMPDAIVKRVLEAKSEEKQSILKMTLESLLNK